MESGFLEPSRLLRGGTTRFNIAVERMLYHLGFVDVRVIDGAYDAGGDILAVYGTQLFVFQNKWTTRKAIGSAAVDEVIRAQARYDADRAVVLTNAYPDGAARARVQALKAVGLHIDTWDISHLLALYNEMPRHVPSSFALREYQAQASHAIADELLQSGRALLVLATGLGKTIVGADVVMRHLRSYPSDMVLVVAHMKDLVQQLEKAFWRQLPKEVHTQVLTGEQKPKTLDGITFATIDSALSAVLDGYRPGLVMVDESHHLGENGRLHELLNHTDSSLQFGVTATPWRGDRFDLTTYFGTPCFKMGIIEGMRQGYLAKVDYRLFVDDIDWSVVKKASSKGYSIRDLNTKLFLPQRDEAVVQHLKLAWDTIQEPKCILFCRTIEHAERMAKLLARQNPAWANATCLHSGHTKREREHLLLQFRLGRIPILTAVDILNEGVDIPDVNLIVFLRVTHSRRIFVQQLGRGLRLKPGKDTVVVLDFVSDIRRIAAVLNIRRNIRAGSHTETLTFQQPAEITFTDQDVGSLMEAWIEDAANLETAMDDSRLDFPNIEGENNES